MIEAEHMICPTCWGEQIYPMAGARCPTCHGDGVFPDLRLSDHFMLSEFLNSETAVRQKIDNAPSSKVTAHLQQLCIQFLEPLRKEVGGLRISSGYRSPNLNEAVRSKPTSAHPRGLAADINSTAGLNRKQLVDRIVALKFKFDQVIFEGTWVHVGLYQPNHEPFQRGEVLATYNGGISYSLYDSNDARIHT
jgi:zinc D-Ala-D-Ala carboxypeptidase